MKISMHMSHIVITHVMMHAAWFWTSGSISISSSGAPYKSEFRLSNLGDMKACTRVATGVTFLLILLIFQQVLVIMLTCSTMSSSLSRMAPMVMAESTALQITASPAWMAFTSSHNWNSVYLTYLINFMLSYYATNVGCVWWKAK